MLSKSFNFFATVTLATKITAERTPEDLELSCGFCCGHDKFSFGDSCCQSDVCERYKKFTLTADTTAHELDKTIYLPNAFRWVTLGEGDTCLYDVYYLDEDDVEVPLFLNLEALSGEYLINQLDLQPESAYMTEWPVIKKTYCDYTFYKRDTNAELLEIESEPIADPLLQPGTLVFELSEDSVDCTSIKVLQFQHFDTIEVMDECAKTCSSFC